MEEIKLYKPPGCSILSESPTDPQIRIGLQGYAGCGKTHSSLTFPNPIVANFDRNLGAYKDRTDVMEAPFWDGKFCDSIHMRDGIANPPNRKDAFLVWLHKEGIKLTENQWLVIDSLSAIEDSYHIQYRLSPVITKKGDEQGFAEYKNKLEFFAGLMDKLRSLKCNVILNCHQSENSKKGGYRPLLSGGYGDKIESNFTSWFRHFAVDKPSNDKRQEFCDRFKITTSVLDEWIKSTDNNTIYIWQTQPDDIADCKATNLLNPPKYILAGYQNFQKYGRKQTIKT
jgi:AAA domain